MGRFKPSVRCFVSEFPEGTDRYGQRVFNRKRPAKCSIVKLATSAEKTAVRTDSSATGGSADETLAAAVLLFAPRENIGIGDLVTIRGVTIKVTRIIQRLNVLGAHDHDQVEGTIHGG